MEQVVGKQRRPTQWMETAEEQEVHDPDEEDRQGQPSEEERRNSSAERDNRHCRGDRQVADDGEEARKRPQRQQHATAVAVGRRELERDPGPADQRDERRRYPRNRGRQRFSAPGPEAPPNSQARPA